MMKVFGAGRFTQDPELRQVNGTSVLEFTLATNEFRKSKNPADGGTVKIAHFYNCVVWDKAAEVIAEKCQKGTRLVIWGLLRQEKWEDKNSGDKRSKHVIRVEEFEIADAFKNTVKEAEPAEAEKETAPF